MISNRKYVAKNTFKIVYWSEEPTFGIIIYDMEILLLCIMVSNSFWVGPGPQTCIHRIAYYLNATIELIPNINGLYSHDYQIYAAKLKVLHWAHTRDSNSGLLIWCLLPLGVVAHPLEKIWFIRGPECGGRKSSHRFRIIMKQAVNIRLSHPTIDKSSQSQTYLGHKQ